MFGTKKRSVIGKAKNDQLIALLNDNVDHADAMDPKSTLGQGIGNPNFVAQFDVSLIPQFYTVAAGTYTQITAAALLAAQPTLATKLPAFVFGNSDFASGFATLKQRFPLAVWTYDAPFIYGSGYQGTQFGVLDATIKAQLQFGDLVIPIYAVLGGTNYLAITIVRCGQVGYGTLLSANNSDMFKTNLVRYNVPDTTATSLAQYQNKIFTYRQSLFGKAENDSWSPNSFKVPEQMQSNIIDIPAKATIDKEASLSTYINYNVSSVEWNVFVSLVGKVN